MLGCLGSAGSSAVLRRSSGGAPVLCWHTQQDTAIAVRHEVDRLGAAGSASNESRSLDHLLLMHTLVGAQWRTSAAAQVEDLARADHRLHGSMQAGRGRAPVMVLVAGAGGTARPRCIRVRRYFHPYPVSYVMFWLVKAHKFSIARTHTLWNVTRPPTTSAQRNALVTRRRSI